MRHVASTAIVMFAVSLVAGTQVAFADGVYLTRDERAQVVALVQSDPRIRAAVDGIEVRVEDILPWSADGTRETLMGGGVTLAFRSPRDVEADWPLMDFPDGPDEYTITTVHYRVQDADAIDAWVDLRTGRVVSFDVRDGEVDPASVRYVDAAAPGQEAPGSRAGSGFRAAGLVAAGLLAIGLFALAAGLAARRLARRRTLRHG